MKGFVIAGTKSGCGKTTVTLGFLAALTRRGLRAAPFKVGPDFIDPGHHTRIAGNQSRNLDGWMLSRDYNLQCFYGRLADTDVAVVEGVMGLFDGYDGKTEVGSTAQMAKWLGLPVILVVDAASMARSAAAVVMGFEHFDPRLHYAGVIFNNLGSRRHLQYLREGVREKIKMPCLGGITRNPDLAMPERHLGLVTREDYPLGRDTVERLADLIEENIDLDLLLDSLSEINLPVRSEEPVKPREKTVRIAVARDNAFCFYYPDNLELLETHGAEIVTFSPMVNNPLPHDIDGIYLGGGYPELFAEKLAGNYSMREGIKAQSRSGMPIYGECGGFMYLCEELIDPKGRCYPMAGCFPFAVKMFPRLKALGYREITLNRNTVIGNTGLTIRGHEFHYSEMSRLSSEVKTAYRIADRTGMEKPPDGYVVENTLGSYNHLHFGSQPEAAAQFVNNCLKYRRRKGKIHATR
ncbi:MAG: cobyrinate a,c-diamide synthase [Desulfobacterales bacterium]|nr:MAG: cobyrinate a,c-diamide synthase [Desulfobacterales bacterium]